MKQKDFKTYTVSYRRKREGKTDYRKRLRLLLACKLRLVVRKSLTDITAQIIEYNEKGDKVIAAARSSELKKLGWGYNCRNTPSAYLLGLLIAKKAKEKKVRDAILDIGPNKSVPGSRVYALLKGAVDNGLNIPHSKEILPDDNRLYGKHIEEYANKIKSSQGHIFTEYKKNNADPANISRVVEEIKNRIIGA
jgi:large subunit ribosomal protein L18